MGYLTSNLPGAIRVCSSLAEFPASVRRVDRRQMSGSRPSFPCVQNLPTGTRIRWNFSHP